jgi:thymidylate synthase ThyX
MKVTFIDKLGSDLTVVNAARVYRQRVDDHAQVEIRRLAQDVGVIVSELYPVSWEALTA